MESCTGGEGLTEMPCVAEMTAIEQCVPENCIRTMEQCQQNVERECMQGAENCMRYKRPEIMDKCAPARDQCYQNQATATPQVQDECESQKNNCLNNVGSEASANCDRQRDECFNSQQQGGGDWSGSQFQGQDCNTQLMACYGTVDGFKACQDQSNQCFRDSGDMTKDPRPTPQACEANFAQCYGGLNVQQLMACGQQAEACMKNQRHLMEFIQTTGYRGGRGGNRGGRNCGEEERQCRIQSGEQECFEMEHMCREAMGPNPCDAAFDACAGTVAGECFNLRNQCELAGKMNGDCEKQLKTCTLAVSQDAWHCARAMNRLDQVGSGPFDKLPAPIRACFTDNGVDHTMGPETTGEICGFAGCLFPFLESNVVFDGLSCMINTMCNCSISRPAAFVW